MLRLPSVRYLVDSARVTFRRFPLVMTFAAAAAVAAIIATDAADAEPFVRLALTAQLGIPLFFALSVAAESNRWRRGFHALWVGLGLIALVAYHFTLPERMNPGAATRFVQFNVALHLLVAFLPFLRGGRHNGFWQYNRSLFMRFLTAVLYSGVTYAGLAVALLAIDQLLGLDVPDSAYARLFIAIGFVFNTWIFLGGIPGDVDGLENRTDYPHALKVFAQYILIPLVAIYLAILTVYLVKIIVTTQWPSGWIGWLVSSVAVVGILAMLLVWPVADQAENRWVSTYTRWFFILMLPAIAMLLLAVYKRIDQYGITENRYFLGVLSIWLAGVAIYFVFSSQRRIKVIPVTLCAVAFATSFGPWGAYTVARRSQSARLERLMTANGILEGGAITKAAGEVSFDDRREISAISLYLVEHHGRDAFDRWVDADAVVDSTTTYRHDRPEARAFVSAMGVEFVESWARPPGTEGRFHYRVEQGPRVIHLDGADYMVRLTKGDSCSIDGTRFVVTWEDPVGIVLKDGATPLAAVRMDSVFARIERNPGFSAREVPAELMRVTSGDNRARLSVQFLALDGTISEGAHAVDLVSADCYITVP